MLWRVALKEIDAAAPGSRAAVIRAATQILRSASQLDGLDEAQRFEIYRPEAEEFMATLNVIRQQMLADQPVEGDIFEIEDVVVVEES